MAVTHTPDTDIISVRNTMIDRLAWELIGMATDRAQEIIDLANQRAYAILRSGEPTRPQSAPTGDAEASPARVLPLPLKPPPPALGSPATAQQAETGTAPQRKRSRDVAAETPSASVTSAPAEGNRGAVKASVLAHLRAHPGEAMTVNTVAKAVGKAAGSIGAALESLTKTDEIARVGESPKTYEWRERA